MWDDVMMLLALIVALVAGIYGGYEWGHAVATKAAAMAADLKEAAAAVKKAL